MRRKIIKINDIANYFGIHRNTVRNMIKRYEKQGRPLDLTDFWSVYFFINSISQSSENEISL